MKTFFVLSPNLSNKIFLLIAFWAVYRKQWKVCWPKFGHVFYRLMQFKIVLKSFLGRTNLRINLFFLSPKIHLVWVSKISLQWEGIFCLGLSCRAYQESGSSLAPSAFLYENIIWLRTKLAKLLNFLKKSSAEIKLISRLMSNFFFRVVSFGFSVSIFRKPHALHRQLAFSIVNLTKIGYSRFPQERPKIEAFIPGSPTLPVPDNISGAYSIHLATFRRTKGFDHSWQSPFTPVPSDPWKRGSRRSGHFGENFVEKKNKNRSLKVRHTFWEASRNRTQ